MRKFILLSFLCFAFFATKAQIIGLTPEVSDVSFQDQDLSINYLDLVVKMGVANLTDDKIAIKWLREVEGDCAGWETAICDNNTCYFQTISSNIMLPDLNEPMYLKAQESFDEMAVHIYPRTNAGCCQIKLHFSLVDDPDNILATATVNGNVNMDENCENEILSSIEDATEIDAIKIFPNPTNEYFKLTSTQAVSTIILRNTLGQELMNYSYNEGGQYDVSNMSAGFYYIQLQDESGATLKLMPLTINAN